MIKNFKKTSLLLVALFVAISTLFVSSKQKIVNAAPNDIVAIPDENFLRAINLVLERGDVITPVTEADMASITMANFAWKPISSIEGAQYLINIQSIMFGNGTISDLSPLSQLPKLDQLAISNNQISDLTPLSSISTLYWLDIRSNPISDISPLSTLTNMQFLSMDDLNVSDISPLSSLTNMLMLSFGDNQVTDLSPLSTMSNLMNLYFPNNQVSDLSPIASLTKMQAMDVTNNNISDISVVGGFKDLGDFYAEYNHIRDFSPLKTIVENQQGLFQNGLNQTLTLPSVGEGDALPFTVIDFYGNVVTLTPSNSNVTYDGQNINGVAIGAYELTGEAANGADFITAYASWTITGEVVKGTPGGQIDITKRDTSTGQVLSGAEFAVKDSSGNIVATLTTDTNGKALTSKLPLGNYTVVETKAPTGYQLDTTPQIVIIDTDKQFAPLNFYNTKVTGLTVEMDQTVLTVCPGTEVNLKDFFEKHVHVTSEGGYTVNVTSTNSFTNINQDTLTGTPVENAQVTYTITDEFGNVVSKTLDIVLSDTACTSSPTPPPNTLPDTGK